MKQLLSVTGLTRGFGQLTAVDRIDLALAPGARHAVIGPNGAGKTTLLHLIAGTLRPSRGLVTFAGRDITTADPARRARLGIARTFQTPALADTLTARENLILGAWRHHRKRGWLARHRDLARRAQRHLDALGIAAHADQPAGGLSHGQRRLLEIGVALAADPTLLLLDEPAAGLTDADLPRLLDCLHRLSGQVAVLLVEHHQDVVTAVAETVTVLDHGRVLATGSPDQIADHPVVAEVYLGTVPAGR